MAESKRTENTAVNRLIELVQTRSVEAVDDSLFERPRPARRPTLPPPFPARGGLSLAPSSPPDPLPRNRVPTSTHTEFGDSPSAHRLVASESQTSPVAPNQSSVRPAEIAASVVDPTEPFDVADADDAEDLADDLLLTIDEPELRAAPLAAKPNVATPVVATTPLAAERLVGAAARGTRPHVAQPPVASEEPDPWFQPSIAVERVDEFVVGTQTVARPSRISGALWLALAFGLGLSVAAAIAWPRGAAVVPVATQAQPQGQLVLSTQPLVSATRATAVTPIAPPVVVPIEVAPIAAVAVVGPTVTPIAPLAVPEVAPLAIQAAKPTIRKSEKVVAPQATKPRAKVAATRPTAPATATSKIDPKKSTPSKTPVRVAAAAPIAKGGKAILMLGAKPPCEILVDGKRTGLRTPQRALALAAGTHKITLVNKQYRITETFSVTLKAGSSTKVIKDLSRRMK